MKKIIGFICFIFYLMFLLSSVDCLAQTNATGTISVNATRPIGNSVFGILYSTFTNPTLPAGAAITGIYPELVISSHRIGTFVIAQYGTSLTNLSTTGGTSITTPSGDFSQAVVHGSSIGTSYTAMSGYGIQMALWQTLYQDGLSDTGTITAVGFAVYYTAPHPRVSGQLPPPFPVPTGSGVSWAVPTTFTQTGFQSPGGIFGQGGGDTTATLGNATPLGYLTLGGTVNIPDAKHFNGSFTIFMQKTGVKNQCNFPYLNVPTQPVIYPIQNGTIVGLSNGSFASQDCLSPRVPYFVQIIDTKNRTVSSDNWYLPNTLDGTVDVGSMQEQKFNGPIAVAIPQGIISTPQGNQTITQPAGTSLTIYGTINFNGTVNYATPPAFSIVKANQVLVNGVTSSSYPVDVNGIINSSAGFCVAGCAGLTVGQALLYNGTSFVPGNITMSFPNQYYQTVYSGGIAVPQRGGLSFATSGFTLSDNVSPGTSIVNLNSIATAGTYSNVATLTLGADGRVYGITTGAAAGSSVNSTTGHSFGFVYQNTNLRSILVTVSGYRGSTGCTDSAYIGSSSAGSPSGLAIPYALASSTPATSAPASNAITFTVPPNWYYGVNTDGCTQNSWIEAITN